MTRIRPKNWSEFQHYKDRRPPWIKLHRGLLDDRAFHRLPVASRALAPMLWLIASESDDGSFDGSSADLAFRLRCTEKEIESDLKPLIDNGFFELLHDASKPLADRSHVAPLVEERRGETEGETEKKREGQNGNRGSRLPSDSVLADDWERFCKTERPDLDPSKVFDSFRDYWTAQPSSKGVKADWFATWRNWVRNTKQTTAKPSQTVERPFI